MDYSGNDKKLQDILAKPKSYTNRKEAIAVVNDQDFLVQIKEKIECDRKTKTRVSNMLQKPNPGGEVILSFNQQPEESIPRNTQNSLQDFYSRLLGNQANERN